ncbi:hypothetical protein, partial [Paraburkholderia kururiensis]|uniref:hypothetical protein n=1 Tax=Paraburkholderia kururiensis TaxID=984307 RepID=UPI001C3F4873
RRCSKAACASAIGSERRGRLQPASGARPVRNSAADLAHVTLLHPGPGHDLEVENSEVENSGMTLSSEPGGHAVKKSRFTGEQIAYALKQTETVNCPHRCARVVARLVGRNAFSG